MIRDEIVVVAKTFFQPPIDSPAEQNKRTKIFSSIDTVLDITAWLSGIEDLQSVEILTIEG